MNAVKNSEGDLTGKSSQVTVPARVLIVDDHQLLRDGMQLMIGNEPDLEICGQASDEAEGMQKARELLPDVVVVDIGLKSGNGLDLIKRIKTHDPEVRIVVSSMHEERLYGERALRAGAEGYVNKQDPACTVIHAIRHVLAGRLYYGEELTNRLLLQAKGGASNLLQSPMETLSDRELEVFSLIGEGLSTREIAGRIHLSTSTIDTYRERLKTKLKLKTATELSHLATCWVLENT